MHRNLPEDETMWRKPQISEICVGTEINSYVSAVTV
jgi:coenzyme PQQ precursor peptide PqqA